MSLDLAGGGHGAVHRFHAEQKAIAPAHERLAVDVLVVLGEVEPAAQRLVDHAAIVAGGKAQLGLDRGAQQRTSELVQVLALHHDAVSRALEGLRRSAVESACLPGAATSSALKPNTLPMIDEVRLAIDPSSKRSMS